MGAVKTVINRYSICGVWRAHSSVRRLPSNDGMCGCCASFCNGTDATQTGQMQHVPRSRKQSKASPPPGPPRIPPPHPTVAPSLRPSASLLNLHIHGQNVGTSTTTTPPSHDTTLKSSASSITDVDINEGILIQDSDQKEDHVETDDVTATGYVDQPGTSEEDRKILRDQLRKTLNQSKSG